MIMAERVASVRRMVMIRVPLIPIFLAMAVSTKRLWEKPNITARMKTFLTVSSRVRIAPMAA